MVHADMLTEVNFSCYDMLNSRWAGVINSMCYILSTALTAAIQKWSKPGPGGIQNLAVLDPQMYPSREAQISNRQKDN